MLMHKNKENTNSGNSHPLKISDKDSLYLLVYVEQQVTSFSINCTMHKSLLLKRSWIAAEKKMLSVFQIKEI